VHIFKKLSLSGSCKMRFANLNKVILFYQSSLGVLGIEDKILVPKFAHEDALELTY